VAAQAAQRITAAAHGHKLHFEMALYGGEAERRLVEVRKKVRDVVAGMMNSDERNLE
jgi:hypothetical protein